MDTYRRTAWQSCTRKSFTRESFTLHNLGCNFLPKHKKRQTTQAFWHLTRMDMNSIDYKYTRVMQTVPLCLNEATMSNCSKVDRVILNAILHHCRGVVACHQARMPWQPGMHMLILLTEHMVSSWQPCLAASAACVLVTQDPGTHAILLAFCLLQQVACSTTAW